MNGMGTVQILLFASLQKSDRIKDLRIFGLFPAFRGFLDRAQVHQATEDLRRLDRTDVVRMTQQVPKEWDVTKAAMDALVDLIVGRAVYVAETIGNGLWPQRDLDFGKTEDEDGGQSLGP